MGKNHLTNDSQFVVGEEKWLNYILAFLFLALFLYGLIDAVSRQFTNIDYQSYVFALALLPAIYTFEGHTAIRFISELIKKVFTRMRN